ncbi:MAG TPA: HAD family hydrolase [Candidatus Dormibacteraeota bacterium]|nr:HAD family hydrolase [Candidatus Dormibacteraeota bacterium]
MTKLQCEGILFDLDGVLVDSTPAVARVWSWWAKKYGFDPEETVHKAHGRPSIATIRELLPNADVEEENREVERREIEDVDGVVPLPGALELLQSLPLDRWAIVTSCTKRLAHVRIRVAGLPEPKFIVTSDDITRGKPDPEPYLKGAQTLSLAAKDCLVIEDAPAGIRSGKSSGARVIALQTTERDELLRRAGADFIVKDCSALKLDSAASLGQLVLELQNAQAAFR